MKRLKENRLFDCENMIGPIEKYSKSFEEKVPIYYCTSPEHGYCDRRSGTCHCLEGYQGISCEECRMATNVKVEGGLCRLRKTCPNDCSGQGTCNPLTGICNCYPGKVGDDCSIFECEDENCVQCSQSNVTICLQCSYWYGADKDGHCQHCSRFDPRCTACNHEACLECTDLLLSSIFRSGGTNIEEQKLLPKDEIERNLSVTVPFGSQQVDAFVDAEAYFLVNDYVPTPLRDYTMECFQGRDYDSSFYCSHYDLSHKICGHVGVVTFSSPEYEVNENDEFVRVTVARSGGGVGTVSVDFNLKHLTTDPSDVTTTAFYTNSQTITFLPGEVRKSFYITINNDRFIEDNETFSLTLENLKTKSENTDKQDIAYLGNQFTTTITIFDDDKTNTCLNETNILWPPSFEQIEVWNNDYVYSMDTKYELTLQAQSCDKTEKVVGGDLFFVEVSCNSKASTSCLKEDRLPITSFCSDNKDGRYRCDFQVPSRLHNELSVAVISYIPEGLFGEYFSDISLKYPLYSRIDKRVNFTWDDEIEKVNEFSSVRWSGSILSNFSEIFEFTLDVGERDNVRMWVGKKII